MADSDTLGSCHTRFHKYNSKTFRHLNSRNYLYNLGRSGLKTAAKQYAEAGLVPCNRPQLVISIRLGF